LPLLLPQALWIKRTALRLPDAAAPWHGLIEGAATAQPLRLLLLGESTVSGVGVASQSDALAGQLAAQLAASWGRSVQWQAVGCNGADAQACLHDLLPQVVAQRWDLVLLVLGVNDTTHLTSRRKWRTHLNQLFSGLADCGERVLVSGVPPLGHFSALPQPLRGWFGLRAGLMDADMQRIAAQSGVLYLPLDLPFESAYLAEDGFHPSAAGYQRWAAGIVAQLEVLESSRSAASVSASVATGT